jgi:hypothetical protein
MTEWINIIFYGSVEALVRLAKLLGISYQEINVWLFCVAWPLMTVLMVVIIWKQYRAIKHLRRGLSHG